MVTKCNKHWCPHVKYIKHYQISMVSFFSENVIVTPDHKTSHHTDVIANNAPYGSK